MNNETLKAAEAAAKEFLARIKTMRESRRPYEFQGKSYQHDSASANGALRRQSMELTRALAAWRKP